MKIQRIDSQKSLDTECERIVIQVGDTKITLIEKHGQLEVFGDDSDLLISCGARNAFTIVTKQR
ncbi:conserved hypothetical protein [Vibrio chagasii]|nr:conserved hypothetical protein [Vibrio chagasii]CAH6964973.1 conserved hypothetical protein [Vibrio chagasii]